MRELLDAFQRAGETAVLRAAPGGLGEVTAGLVTALMRMIVILAAEERGLLPLENARYRDVYSLSLLDEEHCRAMRERGEGGAWARVLRLFRLLHKGPAEDSGISILWATPEKPAKFFDPDAHLFLEGRGGEAPRIDDAAVLRVLDLIRRRKGEAISYQTLDVEHIAGIYEGLTGYSVEEARGACLVLMPDRTTISLEALLALPGAERARALKRQAGVELGDRTAAALSEVASAEALYDILARRSPPDAKGLLPEGVLYLQPGEGRRREGSYYTPRSLAREVVARALAPLLDGKSPAEILSIKVCDPAMGGGAFLMEACRQIALRLTAFEGHEDDPKAAVQARRRVAERCLFGVDQSPLAVELAKVSLWLLAEARDLPLAFLDDRLRCGDSLVGADIADIDTHPASKKNQQQKIQLQIETRAQIHNVLDAWTALWFWPDAPGAPEMPSPSSMESYLMAAASGAADPRIAIARSIARSRRFFHWRTEFPEVFDRPNGGFDALVGNPPWVAYAGRAAQPIEPAVHHFFRSRSPAFFGYRSLHGLFIHRCASLLREGGRLGLVVPTSVSDLDGYEATRIAHDALCEPDPDLPDFGSDAFDGVFQPAMGLLSTRRSGPAVARTSAPPWPLSRVDLNITAARLLERLGSLPPLPAALFGERGFQTSAADRIRIRAQSEPIPPYLCPIHEGADVGEFIVRPPRLYIDREAVLGRFRSDDEWRAVKLYIRQTARYPMVALSDGLPFRNSILAGFAAEGLSEFALLCYLNSWSIRWLHFMRNRDARQGMPQVKIAHLRALPAPPPDLAAKLDAIGRRVGPANAGIGDADRAEIEAAVQGALEMTEEERLCVVRFSEEHPLPKPDR